MTLQMPLNRIVSNRKKTLMRTFGTFDSGFFADSLDPFITAHWRIAGPARLAAFEAARVNIFASAKQRSVKCDFDIRRGSLIYATLWQDKLPDRCVHKPILHLHLPGAPATIHNRQGEASNALSRTKENNCERGSCRLEWGLAPMLVWRPFVVTIHSTIRLKSARMPISRIASRRSHLPKASRAPIFPVSSRR